MAARAGMVSVIARLRSMTEASEDETTIGSLTFWSDDQLQSILDRNSFYISSELNLFPEIVNSAYEYKKYFLPIDSFPWLEGPETTGAFKVVDSNGVEQSSSGYTWYPDFKLVQFTNTTTGLELWLRARTFDINKAAAQVWQEKAGHRIGLIDFKGNQHSMSEDQEFQHCLKMYEHYSGLTGFRAITLVRSGDYN